VCEEIRWKDREKGGRKETGTSRYPFAKRKESLVVGGIVPREGEEEEEVLAGEGEEGVMTDKAVADGGLERGGGRPEDLREGKGPRGDMQVVPERVSAGHVGRKGRKFTRSEALLLQVLRSEQ
jgi:hypothetical protein